MKLAFVGLGNMGRYMATNLAKAGHELTVNDLRREAADPVLEAGATWADSPMAAARGAEAVFLSLPGPKDVEEVVTAANGVLAGMSEGSTVIDLSTNSPSMVLEHGDGGALPSEAVTRAGLHDLAQQDQVDAGLGPHQQRLFHGQDVDEGQLVVD